MTIARGALDVTIEAEPPFVEQDGNKLSRNIVRKEFSGDMVGTSEAQMVAAYTGTPGVVGRDDREPGVLAKRNVSALLESEHAGIERQGFRLVVNEHAD